MGIRYDRTEWENEKTPVNQDNMNNIELGIVNATDAINKLLDGILPAARAIADEDGNNLKMTLINKADLIDGKVPANQLPSYVSNIVEVDTYEDLPNPGEGSTIYVVKNPVETTYRWTGSTYISTDEQSQYYSVKVDTSNIITMGDLYDYITNINNSGLHCFFDLSDFIENAYTCTVLMFTKNLINYCLIFDIINGKTYIDYNGYQTTDLVQDYVNRTGDNVPRIISLNDSNLLVGDIATLLNEINVVGHHVIFDFHELQANCYLCTVLIDTQNNQITIADLVGFRTVTRGYDESATLVSLLENLKPAGGGNSETISITYNELLTLKNNNNLTAGTYYRITDYQCTTPSSNTNIRSAGNQFDIIVQALDVNILDVNAHAINHANDTYFQNNNLLAWELKYDIDGTINSYEWSAAGENSFRGIIFYMKDEFENECYYDFKNIQHKGTSLYECSQLKWYIDIQRQLSTNIYYYLFNTTSVTSGIPGQNDILDATKRGNVKCCKIGSYFNYSTSNNKLRYLINYSIYLAKGVNFRNFTAEYAYKVSMSLVAESSGYNYNQCNLLGKCYNILVVNNCNDSTIKNSHDIKILGGQNDNNYIENCGNITVEFNFAHVYLNSVNSLTSVSGGIAYSKIENSMNIELKESYAFWFSKMGKYCRNITIYGGHNSIELSDSCVSLDIGYQYQSGGTNPRTNTNCHIYVDHVGGIWSPQRKIQLINTFCNNFDGRIVYEGYGNISSSSGFPESSGYADYKIVAKLTDKNNVTNVYQYDTTTQVWSDITKHLYRHNIFLTYTTSNNIIYAKVSLTYFSNLPTPFTTSSDVANTLALGDYTASGSMLSTGGTEKGFISVNKLIVSTYSNYREIKVSGSGIYYDSTTGLINDNHIMNNSQMSLQLDRTTVTDTVEMIY